MNYPLTPPESKPTQHTLDNRAAGDALMRKAAMYGDEIAGAYFELESWAKQNGLGFVTTEVDYDPEDWDDVSPY